MDEHFLKFADRTDAGQQLAERLADMDLRDPVVFALPRGGVPVGAEVARKLGAPLDLILVRKIGAPGNPEVALGAIAEGAADNILMNEDVRRLSGASDAFIQRAHTEQRAELERRKKRYLGKRARVDPAGCTAIVIDDGLATGATMKAALQSLKDNGASRIVVALPVAPESALAELTGLADDVVCLLRATTFRGVGAFYRDFGQLSDEEVIRQLARVTQVQDRPDDRISQRQVSIPPVALAGELSVPQNAQAIIVFVHGSGSSRLSPRNQRVADDLNARGFATLLFDLLTEEEAQDRRNVFDIPLLAERVIEAMVWIGSEPDVADLPVGLFGASTGAAAALVAAAELRGRVGAIVSRGGRPDLAQPYLPQVQSPTLLIVGSLDHDVIALNEQALAALDCDKKLQIVPGAGHLFEEPGTLDLAIGHAGDWFVSHLASAEVRSAAPAQPAGTTDRSILRNAAETLPDINDPAFVAAFDRFGSHRIVLLGESSHGTSEFYRARAAITRRLVEKHGFSIVALEADWPDAAMLNRQIRQTGPRGDRPAPFARFPTWMWRNQEFETFIQQLRDINSAREPADRVGLYGLDLYNMNAAIAEVLRYLDRVDSAAADIARSRYGCLTPWSREPAAYGRAALTKGYAMCEKPVIDMLVDLLKKELDYSAKDGERFFDAKQNARLVANAERYYRAMYFGSHLSWNLRDRHMFETLRELLNHGGPDTKAVVWAHNSHIGDARQTDMGRARGELNIGQLCREEYGDEAALIGFGTASGTVAAASEWDAPMEIKTIRPPLPGSIEALCHAVDMERFLFDFRAPGNQAMRRVLSEPRLERYIGVIYRPETERWSHYSPASLSEQYDAFVWCDDTQAVTPSQVLAGRGEDETFPFGL
ncbi:erythromycin esterase family protein [Yoonia sp.]|uniref:erythromycin esterase family protein n=1 Tax=Yoonia sp. TaxID=2212373 RepID=UPI003F6CF395